MENASHALIMAASVLLLIIALTVAISSLSKLKSQTQDILSQRNQILMSKDENGSYLNYLKNSKDNTERTVEIETIISSIRRMEKESYVIYIATNKNINDSEFPENMRKSGIAIDNRSNIIYITKDGVGYQNITDNAIIYNLYDKFRNSKFKEYYGTFKLKKEGVLEDDILLHKVLTFVEE